MGESMSIASARNKSVQEQSTIVVELSGGMANQLFQWGVATLLANEFGARVLVDTKIVDRPDGRGEQLSFLIQNAEGFIRETVLGRAFWSLAHKTLPRVGTGALKRAYLGITRIGSPRTVVTLDETREALNRGQSVRMRGLFQAADYLYANRDVLRAELSGGFVEMAKPPVGNYAAVHVRRGDYVSNAKYNAIFGTCSERYYRDAIELISDELPVIIVSDDVAWAQEFALSVPLRTAPITVSSGTNHYQDLATLAGASELVLSNSTFSWWGAFLGHGSKTVCPTPWFTDQTRERGIARPEWIGIPR